MPSWGLLRVCQNRRSGHHAKIPWQGVSQKFKPHHVFIKLGILQPFTPFLSLLTLPSQLPFHSLQTYFSNPSFLPFLGQENVLNNKGPTLA